MDDLATADRIEVSVLIENVTDNLSSTPAYVENEYPRLGRRGLRLWSGQCMCCAVSARSLPGCRRGARLDPRDGAVARDRSDGVCWLREVAEQRVHGNTKCAPAVQLANERLSLMALPMPYGAPKSPTVSVHEKSKARRLNGSFSPAPPMR